MSTEQSSSSDIPTRSRASVLARSVAAILAGMTVAAAAMPSQAHDTDSAAPVAQARALSSQLFASPSQVRLVQEKLRKAGYDAGRVDGVWGETTAQAVAKFQRANQLAPTGQLDTSLLSALDIGDVLEGKTSATFLDGLLSASRSETKSASGLGAPLYVSPAHVAQIQQLLKNRGVYNGAVDGVWGESTAGAANKFRTSAGLEAGQGIDIALLQALNQQREQLPNAAAQIAASASAVPLRAGPAALRSLQRELSAKGLDVGAVDGEWGDNTRAAVREYQRAHNLESTGTLTLPTLAALGMSIKDSGQQASIESRQNAKASEQKQPAAVAESER